MPSVRLRSQPLPFQAIVALRNGPVVSTAAKTASVKPVPGLVRTKWTEELSGNTMSASVYWCADCRNIP